MKNPFSFIYRNSFETYFFHDLRLVRDSRDISRLIIILTNVKTLYQAYFSTLQLSPARRFQVRHFFSLPTLNEMNEMIEIYPDLQV